MKQIRQGVFETNSSSTHSLTKSNPSSDYLPNGKILLIDFIDTDDEYRLISLREKVSYLVSHIINKYKWEVDNYEDLLNEVKTDWDYKRIESFVKEKYDLEIKFPKEYKYEIEDIVEINHQLIEHDLDSVLQDLIVEERDLLEEVLTNGNDIVFGRD